jgi:hypothetical protein
MVAVLGGPGTTATESGLHLTLATSPCHSLAALLARKAPHRVPASDVPALVMAATTTRITGPSHLGMVGLFDSIGAVAAGGK